MISLTSQLAPHPDVVSTTLENGEAVLMHMGTANYFTLNSTGCRIWQLLEDAPSLAAVSEQLVAEYEVTPSQAEASVLALVKQLATQQLIELNE